MSWVDGVLGIISIVLGTAIWMLAGGLPAVPSYGDPGADFLPRLISLALMVAGVGLLLIARSLRGSPVDASPPTSQPLAGARLRTAVVLIGLAAAYVIALPRLGFLLSTFVYMLLQALELGARPRWSAGIIGATVTVVLYAVFKVWLRVPLPGWGG